MKKSQRIFVTITAFILIISFFMVMVASIQVRAETVNSLQKKLEESKKTKTQAEQKLNDVRNTKNNIVTEKNNIDKQIASVEDEVLSLSNSISKSDAEIAQKEIELTEAEKQAKEYDGLFKTRASVMYERGSATYLDVLFGAENFSDFLYKVEMVKQIVDYDKEILKKMSAASQVIRNSKTEIENQKSQKEYNLQILENKKTELSTSLAAREQVIAKLTSQEAEYKKVLDQADKEEAKLKSEIQSQLNKKGSSSSTKYTGGKLLWPTPSTTFVTSPYGTRFHPTYKRNIMHTGIDIGAGYGAAVLAAEAGTVLRAGWNGGYGKYIVIDHGGGIQTLYGHNSSLLVSAGDKVTKGQKIAAVGSTGNSTGPHLHFEVLINGQHTNPMGYFN